MTRRPPDERTPAPRDPDAERRERRRARRRAVRRRRLVAVGILLAAVTALGALVARLGADGTASAGTATRAAAAATTTAGTPTTAPTPTTPETLPDVSGPPSDRTRLRLRRVLTGPISPKSVASSGTGYVTAQNMMYRHTITVYDARRMRLVRTIPDTVRLARFGISGHPGVSRGAPVEAAFTSDGRYAWVSNYSMYGAGFGPEGSDSCTPSSGTDRSFVYRIDMRRLAIDRVVRVGAVPKVVAVTPDDRYVLVSNWCTWDLSVIATRSGREVRRIPIGPYPRGIAVLPGGKAAYVAVMGGTDLVRVDLRRFTTRNVPIGSGPRALAVAPDARSLYATLNAEGRVAKLDLRTLAVRAKIATGSAPRSLARSADGRALYVVNYESGTVTKLRTRDMAALQTIDACYHPIGITYDRPTRRVWVACYTGSIRVYDDR